MMNNPGGNTSHFCFGVERCWGGGRGGGGGHKDNKPANNKN